MSSLLDDLKGEAHEHTLAFGNIPSKRLPGFKPPVEQLERFHATGYQAIISVTFCKACRRTTKTLSAIMATEEGDKGSKRSQALFLGFVPNLSTDSKPVGYVANCVNVCIHCIGNYGFIEDPTAEYQSFAHWANPTEHLK